MQAETSPVLQALAGGRKGVRGQTNIYGVSVPLCVLDMHQATGASRHLRRVTAAW